MRSRILPFKGELLLSVLLVFASLVNPVFAAEPIVGPTTPVGPIGPVGPTTPVGPTGPVGPEAGIVVGPITTPGPTGPTGPESLVTTQASPSPEPITTASGTNSNTGSNSNNQNATSTSNTTNATVNNTANTNNNVNANLNTGNNDLDSNTQVGEVSSGNINGVLNIVNISNAQLAEGSSVGTQSLNAGGAGNIILGQIDTRASLQGDNNHTGSNSNNQNSLQNSNVLHVVHMDRATANNNVGVNADTGGNDLTQNTKVGGLKTGDINLAVNVINLLNVAMPNTQLNMDIWSILTSNPNASITVPLQGSNNQTGSGSNNQNAASTTNDTGITVNRLADSNNNVVVNATTGGNDVSQNSETGNVHTGDTEVGGSTVNISNASIPTFYIVNVFGEWNGTLQGLPAGSFVINRLDNSDTGSNSNNQNSQTASNTSTYGLNQNATAHNNLNVKANTGGNKISGNSSVGDISTGSVHVLANLVNILNSWSTQYGKFNLGVINIFASKPTPNGSVAPASVTSNTAVVESNAALAPQVAVGGGQAQPGAVSSSGPVFQGSSLGVGGSSSNFPFSVNAAGSVVGGGTTTSQVNVQGASTHLPSQLASVAGASTTKTPTPTSTPWKMYLILAGLAIWLGVEGIGHFRKKQQ